VLPDDPPFEDPLIGAFALLLFGGIAIGVVRSTEMDTGSGVEVRAVNGT